MICFICPVIFFRMMVPVCSGTTSMPVEQMFFYPVTARSFSLLQIVRNAFIYPLALSLKPLNTWKQNMIPDIRTSVFSRHPQHHLGSHSFPSAGFLASRMWYNMASPRELLHRVFLPRSGWLPYQEAFFFMQERFSSIWAYPSSCWTAFYLILNLQMIDSERIRSRIILQVDKGQLLFMIYFNIPGFRGPFSVFPGRIISFAAFNLIQVHCAG